MSWSLSKKAERDSITLKVNLSRPKRYTYPLTIIHFCVALKLCSSVSFRALNKVIVSMNLYFDCSLRTPSHATILLWVKKYCLFLLSKPVQKAQDWVVIIDESVQFGQNKLLLVYGIRHSDIPNDRGLVFSDLTPLVLASKSSWTGDLIAQELDKLEESIGTIKYGVADQGNSIRKALKIKEIFHVYDITHCISIIVEHVYKSDPEFIQYTKKLAHLRGAQALGKNAHLLPPAQRVNSRYMNLRPISDWGMSVLHFLEKAPQADYQAEKTHLN